MAAAALGGRGIAPFGCCISNGSCLAVAVAVGIAAGAVSASRVRRSVIVGCSAGIRRDYDIYLVIGVQLHAPGMTLRGTGWIEGLSAQVVALGAFYRGRDSHGIV